MISGKKKKKRAARITFSISNQSWKKYKKALYQEHGDGL